MQIIFTPMYCSSLQQDIMDAEMHCPSWCHAMKYSRLLSPHRGHIFQNEFHSSFSSAHLTSLFCNINHNWKVIHSNLLDGSVMLQWSLRMPLCTVSGVSLKPINIVYRVGQVPGSHDSKVQGRFWSEWRISLGQAKTWILNKSWMEMNFAILIEGWDSIYLLTKILPSNLMPPINYTLTS